MTFKIKNIAMIKNLEKSLEELENIVSQLEKGEKPLNDSLDLFEKGIQLTKKCQQSLSQAEQKIQTMTTSNSQNMDLNE